MTLSTDDAVRETYRLALEQEITRKLKTKPEWERFLAIAKESRDRQAQEETAIKTDYTERLAAAREIVLRERTGRHYTVPSPAGMSTDPFDKEAIDRAAHARVRHDHVKRIGVILQDQIDAYKALRGELIARDAKRGVARERFTLTNQISPQQVHYRGRSGPS